MFRQRNVVVKDFFGHTRFRWQENFITGKITVRQRNGQTVVQLKNWFRTKSYILSSNESVECYYGPSRLIRWVLGFILTICGLGCTILLVSELLPLLLTTLSSPG
jgi:hypothetical protein